METRGMRQLLMAEGLALFLLGVLGFHALGNVGWGLFAILFFVPDVSFLAYLVGPRFGAVAYNALHSTIVPTVVAALGWFLDDFILRDILWATAATWMAHIGFDRMLGYGLKHFSGFRETHLGTIGRK